MSPRRQAGRQAGRQGDALSAPLSVALAQLVVLEMAQAAQLADTRAAIAAIEKLSGCRAPRAPVAVAVPANGPAPVARRVPASASSVATPALVKGHAGAAAAAARATAILRLIDGGTRVAVGIRDALPLPAGVNDHQHRQSVGNALARLSATGCIVKRDDGWALTAKGRTRAAKEAP